jgi:molybdopterin synthase catalytic subunit
MIRVQRQDFDPGEEQRRLAGERADIGAIVAFTGTVRDRADGEPIETMTLEHYPGMTERELERIEAEARRRFDIADCLVVHRYGELRPGDRIVLVIALSAHRREAFAAAEFIMDYLKTAAPFWKKETTAAGSRWVAAKDSDEAATKAWLDGEGEAGTERDR